MKRRLLALVLLFSLLLAVPAQAFTFTDVSNWAVPELEEALALGILPESIVAASMDQPITRLEFCQALMLTYELRFGAMPEAPAVFTDTIDASVLSAADLGLVNGYGDGTFRPFEEITREQLMAMLYRLMKLCDPSLDYDLTVLTRFTDHASVSGWAKEEVAACIGEGMVKGSNGKINPRGNTTRQEAVALLVRLTKTDRFGLEPPTEETPDLTLEQYLATPALTTHGYWDSYNETKHCFIFGSTEVSRYDTSAVELVTMTVPVWKLNTTTGEKYSSTATFQMNSKLEAVVYAIFQEIYQGEERFPLNYVGGYRAASATSEHTTGLSIDLNPGSNPKMSKSLEPYEQGYRPGEDPLSIPADGDVVRAFNKYGFFWGGEGWSKEYDFMHFSYFGT